MFKALLLLCLMFKVSIVAAEFRLPDGERLADPTKPANQPVVSTQKQKDASVQFKLSYILAADARRLAIINGQRVVEGDWIAGAQVRKIDRNSVTLLINGRSKVLTVSTRPSIKQ